MQTIDSTVSVQQTVAYLTISIELNSKEVFIHTTEVDNARLLTATQHMIQPLHSGHT